MLLLRAVLLELLVCFHVIGGAVIFRRLFPRESPWLAFIVPTLIVMSVFNFLEHFIAMPGLGWLLPVSIIGLGVAIFRPGYSWEGLRFPAGVFVGLFTWALFIRCMNPVITANTEGVADMARVLDFCLGSTLPPVDTWCPPYDHGGYYTFQHYGASLLKRLFSLDIGTGYNMGYVLLNTLTLFAGAGAAYVISGGRVWVTLATLAALLGNYNGSSILLLFYNTAHPVPGLFDIFDNRLANDIGDGWNDPTRHNPFGWIFHSPPPGLRLFLPAFNTYVSEFHANLGGHFLTLASLLAANEAFREQRSNWPWICLLVFPFMTIITSIWFVIVVGALCAGSLAVALIAGRRPEKWTLAIGGSGIALACLWASINSLLAGSYPMDIHLTPAIEYTPALEFLIQWWPVIIPWLALFFIYGRLSLLARLIHALLPLLLIFVELVTFDSRTLTVEKMWGAVYGAALVTFLPLVFLQTKIAFRFIGFITLVISVLFILAWGTKSVDETWSGIAFHIRGDTVFTTDSQKKRLLQILNRYHGATILDGRSKYAYNESPSLVGFSENMCYIAWFFQEYQCGHGGEAEFRDKQSNQFYDGKMPNPLSFLRSNNISAIVIYPEDKIPNEIVDKFKEQLAADYLFLDCKGDDPNAFNAGVFVRQPGAPAFGTNLK